MTADMEGEFVVFLIGMRINKWWKLRSWLPVFFAMPRMDLARDLLFAARSVGDGVREHAEIWLGKGLKCDPNWKGILFFTETAP